MLPAPRGVEPKVLDEGAEALFSAGQRDATRPFRAPEDHDQPRRPPLSIAPLHPYTLIVTRLTVPTTDEGEDCANEWNASAHDQEVRPSRLVAIASACARLHHHRLQQGCLYGKHLFVGRRAEPGFLYAESDVRFDDLEKLCRGASRERDGA